MRPHTVPLRQVLQPLQRHLRHQKIPRLERIPDPLQPGLHAAFRHLLVPRQPPQPLPPRRPQNRQVLPPRLPLNHRRHEPRPWPVLQIERDIHLLRQRLVFKPRVHRGFVHPVRPHQRNDALAGLQQVVFRKVLPQLQSRRRDQLAVVRRVRRSIHRHLPHKPRRVRSELQDHVLPGHHRVHIHRVETSRLIQPFNRRADFPAVEQIPHLHRVHLLHHRQRVRLRLRGIANPRNALPRVRRILRMANGGAEDYNQHRHNSHPASAQRHQQS